MKGEPPRQPAEVKLDVPTDAFLPTDYVAKEELRLEAYRRLAAVTSADEVDDIRAEWEDRYGPIPPPAMALLDVAALRGECHRFGLRDISIATSQARLAPITLRTSEEIRLKRLSRTALLKPEQQQLVVPLPRGEDPAAYLVGLLRELRPPEAVSPAVSASQT
jgi:transcription-repair coupling factor (superfamily II helicase)